jgi:hypothetical protein
MAEKVNARDQVVRGLRRRNVIASPILVPQSPVLSMNGGGQGVPASNGTQLPQGRNPMAGPSTEGLQPRQYEGALQGYAPQFNAPSTEGLQPAQTRPPSAIPPPTGAAPPSPVTPLTETQAAIEGRISKATAERDAIAAKPVEDDDGKLFNFYKGTQHAARMALRTGADPATSFGMLVGGGLRGLFMGKEDDQREKDAQLAKLDEGIDADSKRLEKVVANRLKQTQIEYEQARPERERAEKERQNVSTVVNKAGFNPNAPENADLVKKANELGVYYDKAPKPEKKHLQYVAPTETEGAYSYDPDTGQRTPIEGSKPKQGKPVSYKLTDDDRYEKFGLLSEDIIKRDAEAAVGKTKERRIKKEFEKYQNPDGSLNYGLMDLDGVDTSDSAMFEDLPDNSAQSKAQKQKQLFQSQSGMRKTVDRFETQINHRTPLAEAPTVTVADAEKKFRELLDRKAKNKKEDQQNKQDLNDFIESLKYANVQ